MKKVFLFLTMLLFAFTGTMKAESLTVHDGTTTNGNVPVYGFYADAYNKCEMVYPATELGEMAGGMINSMTFYASESSVSWGANFQVFLAEVENATISAFAGPGTVVYEGQLSIADGEMVVTFDTPYAYAGGNLLVGVYETSTGSYITSYWYGESVTGASGSGYNYNSLADCSFGQKNFLPKVTFDYTVGGGAQTAFSTTPSVLDLGYRPNGAWMAPYVFKMKSNVGAVTVNALDFSGNYFTYNAELPATVSGNNPLEVAVNHGEAEPGEVNSTITILYSGNNRDAEQLDIKATAYNPVEGDVFEQAIAVPALAAQTPYTTQFPEGMYKNYELPVATEANDAVYQLTFNQDVLLYAGAEDGNVVLYTEDFNGEDGPMADNQYVYNGPQINPGPTNIWFSYDYTGSNTWYGTSAGGGFYFGYKLSTDVIAANGLAGLTITQVKAAAREAYPYHCYIIEGGVDPFDGNMISEGTIENPTALYFFDINLNMPAYISGDSDIWVIFYSDSPYAAYCGRYPSDTNNGKIWTYNPNASSPAWTSNVNYTPVIYAHMLELPTGREVTMDLGGMKIKEGNGVASEIAEAEGSVMNAPKAQIAQNNRGNRDVQTLIEEGFEGGIGDWTLNHCHNNTGVTSAYTANTGSYVFRFYYTTAYPQYLISPELSDNNGGIFSFYAAGYDTDYIETFQLGYSTTTNDPSAFTWGSELSLQNEYEYAQYSSVFPAGTKYVAIACTSDDQFYLFVDDIVVTADITSGGGGGGDEPTWTPYEPTFAAEIDGMYVPAGTYYLVAAAADNAAVNIAINDVPAPEQAVVISPADGETNVGTPYLAEWILGDYTVEMQVLLGTQYPPQTVFIDWTDYLVESAFITDLEPNQSYFMQVNERNAAGLVTEGEIVAFTTPIDPVEGLAVEETNLYPGDAAALTWTANARTLKGYNVYVDGVKWNESLINTNSYDVEGLEYNMAGYNITVTSVYDAGESEPSEAVTVFMTGNGSVSGHAYDKPDEDTDAMPIAFATVMFSGSDEYGVNQTFVVEADAEGAFSGEILAGTYTAYVITEGYDSSITVNATVNYDALTDEIDIYTHEYYYPLQQITATEQEAENNVLVEWSWTPAEMIVDFESGDFSQADFTLPAQYPWVITTTHPYEGTYCMKSTCEGQASASSSIEATVDVPFDGLMGFWVKVSSESNYDKFHFYIDGVEQGSAMSGNLDYQYKEYVVSEGTHTYKWEYAKDSSVNSNDDCVYVDYVTMYKQAGPAPSGQSYNFDDSSLQGWTSLDADGDGNGWLVASEAMSTGYGHNASTDCVLSKSYDNTYGVLYPDNYLVSPFKMNAQNGAAITFWACGQDASYAAEHFGVAVSTGSNNTAADFTTIQEWTMTAKGAAAEDAYSEIRGTRTQGTWYEYTVDLSSYAGQEIWVAIRHFNCSDMFYLDVDDITLGDGSEVAMTRGGNRSLMSYNLYRRNNIDPESMEDPELIAPGIAADVMSYIDNEWDELDFGEYQWGIQATYEGYAPEADRSRETYTYTFDSGLEGWTNIDADGDGNVWYNSANSVAISGYDYSTLGHNGTGCFMVSQSYTDLTYDAFNADNYLVSPQKYAVDASSSITFWHDYANDSYPDYYEVMVSTAANPGANDFTAVWTSGSKSAGNGAKIRNTNSRYENWQEQTVSLAAYAGQEVWIAFHHEDYDNYEIWIDDVTITAGSAPTPGPTPGPTGNGLSEILWSNVIDKDMVSTVKFAVALNNGQSPAGAEIELTGIYNEYEFTVESDTLVVEMRKDVYAVAVELEGYYPFEGELDLDEDEEIMTIVLTEIIAPVSDFYVSPTGWAKWEGTTGGGVTPTPPTPPTGASTFSEGFEGGLNGWNVLTVNADGGEWLHSSEQPYGHDYSELAHTGTGFAICYSFVDYTGAFDTDSYMYTPQKYNIVDGSTLTFWADNANDSYPENFSVCVATADNPTAADFTQVWSGGAKGTANGGAAVRHSNNRYQNWRSHNIDLSAYAGQSVWIAFHDVNYDAYEIWIDDVELGVVNKGDRAALSYKVFLEGEYVGETVYPFYQVPVAGLTEGETYTVAVAPLYATGMGETMYASFVYEACSHYAGATEYTATVNDNNVALSWTLNGQPGPQPGPGAGSFTCGFEEGLPEGWTVLDGNNDGWTWCLTSAIPSTWTYYASLTLDWYRTGSNAICSGSYINGVGALTPNEYLVTPQVTIGAGSTFSFWAAATDATYAADHFGVFVSDNGTSDWTSVQEWTLTAKESTLKGGRESREGDGAKLGTWYQYTVDLSAYAGNKYIAIRHFNCNDQYIMCVDDVEFAASSKGGNRDMWDYLTSFTGTSAGQQAVATDGEYIYTASWQTTPTGGYTFYKYDLEGNFVEGFDIAGATGIRDLTFDGDYFYGTSGGAQIFCLDLANKTLVSTINCSGLTSRHISYDPERDGFWSGNWTTLALYSRTGALIQNGPTTTSAYGSAYYKDSDNVEHLFLFCQPNSDCQVYDYNITTGTLSASPVLDYTSTTPGCTGIAGGCFIGGYDGKTCWFGNSQQDPNLIAIYELDSEGPTPGPQPIPGDILGVMVWRDGEPLTMEPITATSYTDANVAAGEHEYCIRVVYSDWAMACDQCETVTVGEGPACDPVTNLTAEPYTYNGNDGALIQFTEPAGATEYKVYVDGQLLGSIAAQPIFINFEGSGDGNYEIGIVAVYAECESDMATVMFTWDSVNETEIVNAIYPNPTSSDLHINATAMTHVTVYNAMGQMVLDQEVSGDEVILNMGQFEAGIYMVKVTTETGSSVKRITVAK